jgi:hypothetical protein
VNTVNNTGPGLSGIALAVGLLSLASTVHAEVIKLTVAANGMVSHSAPGDPFLLDMGRPEAVINFATTNFDGQLTFCRTSWHLVSQNMEMAPA